MWIAITMIIIGVLFFAFFVFTNERRKRKEKGITKKPKKEKVKKEKKVKEPKQKKQDTDEVPNYEGFQVLGSEDSPIGQQGNPADNASTRDLFSEGRSDGYFQKEMDHLFEKDNRNRSQRNAQRNPFQSTYSGDTQGGGYASAKPRDASSGENKRRSIRNIDIHKGLSQSINPYSIGEEFGYTIGDFDGRSEHEIAAIFRDLPPEIRVMIVSNILAQKYD